MEQNLATTRPRTDCTGKGCLTAFVNGIPSMASNGERAFLKSQIELMGLSMAYHDNGDSAYMQKLDDLVKFFDKYTNLIGGKTQ